MCSGRDVERRDGLWAAPPCVWLTVTVFQSEDLLLHGLTGRITGVYRCQIGFQGQAAILGSIDTLHLVLPEAVQSQN